MKLNIYGIVLVGSLLTSAVSLAECDNTSIAINKPDSLYVDHANGTVTDADTNLMWQKCSLGFVGTNCEISTFIEVAVETELDVEVKTVQLFSWQAASVAANESIVGTYSDWRLPNIKELASLVENSCQGPSVNSVIFPNSVSGLYWTSSPAVGVRASARSAWAVSFINGIVDNEYKFQTYSVRLVRNSIGPL